MTTGYFETPVDLAPALAGKIEADVFEVGGVKPTYIIRTNQDWYVDIHWELTGSIVPMICGEWCVHLVMESIGPGAELKLQDYDYPYYIPLDPCGDGKYHLQLDVKKDTIKPEHCSTPYKPVLVITYLTYCKKPGPIAGFVELPMLQFFDAS
jgi:hypothetical protein